MTYDVISHARRTTHRRLTAIGLAAAATAAAVTIALVAGATADRPVGSPSERAEPAVLSSVDAEERLPSDMQWVDVAGVSVPVSSRSGPRITSGGQARGFAHDQVGAVLAAVHIVVRINPQVGPAVFGPTLRDQVVGPHAAAMRVQVAQAYDELRAQLSGQPLGRLTAILRGYRIGSYRDDEAAVGLLTEAPGANGVPLLVVAEVRVRWTGSDWALLAPAGGTFEQTVMAASDADTATFLPFTVGG
ncbi:hypothetical protein J3R08_002572 [Micromonospora sp. HB375]|uniref:hypothetical protein n=1 Tax=unclassified Micromonospora TaxID=2617518 RepID=UPI001AEAA270|nr:MULTISPECIES: hypothetical protein [unclassified Micromonospora]MBP1782722.1 hypothetical protein [Micromonospora sp. HB375]MDH6472030.1 hypothetical protein [Micromonospora sp. H404/HB375]